MSGATAAPPTVSKPRRGFGGELWRRWNAAEAFSPPSRREWPGELRRALWVGGALFAIQLILFGWWSGVLVDRFALTSDFTAYNQATWLIAHGHLNPYSTVFFLEFWHNNGEFIFWLLAPFEAIYPHLVTLKWLQDVAIVVAELVAFRWMCEIAATQVLRGLSTRVAVTLVVVGGMILLGDPWLTWTVSFDAHPEAFSVPFLVLAARDTYLGRRRAWIWVVLTLACGTVPSSYVGALGISMILAGRRWWRPGLVMAIVGFGWMNGLHALHAAAGSGISGLYGPLIAHADGRVPANASAVTLVRALLEHPGRFASVLWANGLDMWAVLSAAGLLGIIWPPALVPALIILVEGGLSRGYNFAFPSFQNAALVPLVAVGTVAVLTVLARRAHRRWRYVTGAVVLALLLNAVGWGAVWIPRTSGRWLRIPVNASHVLAQVKAQVRPRDEVIVEQGVAGGFSERASIYQLVSADLVAPIKARTVWIIFAPRLGIETAPVAGIYADMRQAAALPGVRLARWGAGVWAFRWTPPRGTRSLAIGRPGFGPNSADGLRTWKYAAGLVAGPATEEASITPGWAIAGIAGRPRVSGPVADWHSASDDRSGYVVDRAYWTEPTGRYVASATVATTGQANVEVWDDSDNRLLARASLPGTRGRVTVHMAVAVAARRQRSTPTGIGPWSAVPQPPVAGSTLEVRVWTPGGSDSVDVYDVAMQRAGS